MAPQHFGKHSVTAKILIYWATGYTDKLVSERARHACLDFANHINRHLIPSATVELFRDLLLGVPARHLNGQVEFA